jgi:hypothetical protein
MPENIDEIALWPYTILKYQAGRNEHHIVYIKENGQANTRPFLKIMNSLLLFYQNRLFGN